MPTNYEYPKGEHYQPIDVRKVDGGYELTLGYLALDDAIGLLSEAEQQEIRRKMTENAQIIADRIEKAAMDTIKRRLDDWLMFGK